jgi:hypothetical protein
MRICVSGLCGYSPLRLETDDIPGLGMMPKTPKTAVTAGYSIDAIIGLK